MRRDIHSQLLEKRRQALADCTEQLMHFAGAQLSQIASVLFSRHGLGRFQAMAIKRGVDPALDFFCELCAGLDTRRAVLIRYACAGRLETTCYDLTWIRPYT